MFLRNSLLLFFRITIASLACFLSVFADDSITLSKENLLPSSQPLIGKEMPKLVGLGAAPKLAKDAGSAPFLSNTTSPSPLFEKPLENTLSASPSFGPAINNGLKINESSAVKQDAGGGPGADLNKGQAQALLPSPTIGSLPKNHLSTEKTEGSLLDEKFASDVSVVWNKINSTAEDFKKKASALDLDFKKSNEKISSFTKEIDPKVESLQEFYDEIKNYFSSQKSVEPSLDFKQKISMLDFSLREFAQALAKLDQTLSDLDLNFTELSELIKKKNILMPGLLLVENDAAAIKTESVNFKKKSEDEKKSKYGLLESFVGKVDKFVADLQDIETNFKAKSDSTENKINSVKAVLDDLSSKEKQIESDVKIISQLKQKDSTASEMVLLKKISEEKNKKVSRSEIEELKDFKRSIDVVDEESLLIPASLDSLEKTRVGWLQYLFQKTVVIVVDLTKAIIPFFKRILNALLLIDEKGVSVSADKQEKEPGLTTHDNTVVNSVSLPAIKTLVPAQETKPLPLQPIIPSINVLQPLTSSGGVAQPLGLNKADSVAVLPKADENNLESKKTSSNFAGEIKSAFLDIFTGFVRLFKSLFNYFREVYNRI